MRAATLMTVILVATLSPAAWAGPQEEAVKGVVEAVKRGDDLGAAFPDAVSAREIASLRRVSKCSATNLMRQEPGRYTVVWNCGAKGALGMEVRIGDAGVASVATFEVVKRPSVGHRH